ncbi:26S proteasome non-ATPase regulatory subunit 13 [Chamberlinius hualienensis]
MPRDVQAYITSQINSSPPELAAKWNQMEEYYNKRLWHQLTLYLLDFVKDPSFSTGDELLNLYENVIADFEMKINPISLVEMVVCVCKRIEDPLQAIEFLQKTQEKVKGNAEAAVLCMTIIGQIKLTQLKDVENSKKLIEETETLLDTLNGICAVHGKFYDLSSNYYRLIGKHAEYYRDALRYLGCTDINDLSKEEQMERAFYLCLAALLGSGVYNFGELLAHPVLESLKNTDKQWLVDFLGVFNSGNIGKYESMRPLWQSQPDLASNELNLRQKISLLCLMEMTFRRPAINRQLTFAEISEEACLPEEEVELLVMKALSLNLVKGFIDQVDRKVHMHWVQPRVLDRTQIAVMQQQLEKWCSDVSKLEVLVEDKAHDILA